MTRPVQASLCALWLLSACNVASVQEQKSTVAQNQCTSNSECPNGFCADNQCRTSNGTFETLLFTVTPPADASKIAGVQFLKVVTDVSKSGGSLELPLDLVSELTGGVTLSARDCMPKFDDNGTLLATAAADSSIPAVVSFFPSDGALGLFVSPSAAEATLFQDKQFQFRVNIPPGKYDIYVEPKHQPDDSCVVPPQLLRDQVINGGLHPLNIALPQPSAFALHVSWPLATDHRLDGWSVDMLDAVSGRVISNSAALALEKGGYVASLSYLPVVGDTSQAPARELVRLSPPDGQTAPTVLLARDALSLFSANTGTLSQFTALPTPVRVEGEVTSMSTPTPVSATVTLVATKINGVDPGVIASFVRTVVAEKDGKVAVDLLPGTYRVSAVPVGNSDLAQASTQWLVADSPSVQAGKLIELSDTLPINGEAFDAAGVIPLAGAPVQAIASPASIVTDVLHVALGEAVYVPRASNGAVGLSGSFALNSDLGTFDFSVRPDASTGFPWLVIPGLGVGTNPSNINGPGLKEILSQLPVLYSGSVTYALFTPPTVSGALIRGYVYMRGGAYTADPTRADSVLQIAETRSDENGNFNLFIPASLNTVPTP